VGVGLVGASESVFPVCSGLLCKRDNPYINPKLTTMIATSTNNTISANIPVFLPVSGLAVPICIASTDATVVFIVAILKECRTSSFLRTGAFAFSSGGFIVLVLSALPRSQLAQQ
jgi:hypothetical protein